MKEKVIHAKEWTAPDWINFIVKYAKIKEKAEELVDLVFEKTNSSDYTEVWVSVICFLVKNFLGQNDELEKIIIKGKNDVGEHYIIRIKY
jgi:hypothetical protein